MRFYYIFVLFMLIVEPNMNYTVNLTISNHINSFNYSGFPVANFTIVQSNVSMFRENPSSLLDLDKKYDKLKENIKQEMANGMVEKPVKNYMNKTNIKKDSVKSEYFRIYGLNYRDYVMHTNNYY